jgi:hypothetical protein
MERQEKNEYLRVPRNEAFHGAYGARRLIHSSDFHDLLALKDFASQEPVPLS